MEGTFSDSHAKNGTQIGHFSRFFWQNVKKIGLLGRKKLDEHRYNDITIHANYLSFYGELPT